MYCGVQSQYMVHQLCSCSLSPSEQVLSLPPEFAFHTLEKTSTANQSNLDINWGLKHNVPVLVLSVALLNFTALGHTLTQAHRSTLIPGAT